MKRIFAVILAALVAAALFGGLVHAVLVGAHVSEPAATTVYGLTLRRLWATTVAVLALGGVVIGGLALTRQVSRFGTASGRLLPGDAAAQLNALAGDAFTTALQFAAAGSAVIVLVVAILVSIVVRKEARAHASRRQVRCDPGSLQLLAALVSDDR